MAQRRKETTSKYTARHCSRRSRGFGGCTTCRQKRMKCDEHRPQCSVCTSLGLLCTYEKNLFFDLDAKFGSEDGRFRRPILTEEERRLMSQSLATSIGRESTISLIYAIENECEASSPTVDLQVHRGPFGAFRWQDASSQPASNTPQDCVELDKDASLDFSAFSVDQIASPNTLALANSLFDQSEVTNLQPTSRDPWQAFTDNSSIHEILDDLDAFDFPQSPSGIATPASYGSPHFVYRNPFRPPSTSLTKATATPSACFVPDEAVPLLRHYQTKVLQSLTPFRHSKTPWHVLFLPQAKNSLAALTLGDTVDSATLCSFYGTLAISASSLSGVSFSSRWREFASTYQEVAEHHIKTTLQTAYDLPKRAKYKSILIALLTMVQLSVICGNSDQTETYFLEAEKFIRLRGLAKKKSRKVRLLHHCYAFERILYESTTKVAPGKTHRIHVRNVIEASGTMVTGQDALSFRLGQWSNLEEEMRRIKGQNEGENDLHLQNPGSWPATLYPEIFGVPEQTLTVVSLIIRLAKEKEKDEQGLGLRLSEYLERAKAIERLIQQMEPSASDSDLSNLQEAMHLSLSIYFYRTIYDVDSSILGDKVRGVLRCLNRSMTGQSMDSFGVARYNWPALVAATEAIEPDMQSSFSAWLQNAEKQTGLQFFITTLATAERTWNAQRSASAALMGGRC